MTGLLKAGNGARLPGLVRWGPVGLQSERRRRFPVESAAPWKAQVVLSATSLQIVSASAAHRGQRRHHVRDLLASILLIFGTLACGAGPAAAPPDDPAPEGRAPEGLGSPASTAPMAPARAAASEAPSTRLRLCTGEAGNAYHTLGTRLAAHLKGRLNVEVIESAGSWENLTGIDADPRRCDAIIAQDDADALYHYEKTSGQTDIERLGTLYPEYAHVICNRSLVKAHNVAGLHPQRHRLVVDRFGSGTFITWRLFGRLSPMLQRLKSTEASLEEGLAMVVEGREAQCMMVVSALGRGIAALADQRHGTALVLLSIDDVNLERPVGRDRRPVYRISDLPADAYRDLGPKAWRTVAVEAVFFVSSAWRRANAAAAGELVDALKDCCKPDAASR